MFRIVVILFCAIGLIPDITNSFNILIIPVSDPKTLFSNLKSKSTKHHLKRNDFSKLDIESYEVPTDIPDLDNLDLQEDRNSKFNRDLDQYDHNHGNDRHERREDYFEKDVNMGEYKIVGGFEVDINLYPYHVAYGANCGGAIIDRKWVLTAGHCGKKPYVKVGSKYLNQGRKVAVKAHHIHPMWGASSKDHPFDFDFQLLELNENLKFDANVQPVKVAHIEDMTIGKVVTVTGWGNTEENLKWYIADSSGGITFPYTWILQDVRAKTWVPPVSYGLQTSEYATNCWIRFDQIRGESEFDIEMIGLMRSSVPRFHSCSGAPAVNIENYSACFGPFSNVLRAVRVPIISKENCQRVPFPYFRGALTARMFCAGFTEGKKDACQGDSGGPAVAFDRLLGMVSFGYGCATPGSYGVYSKVAKVRPWIEEITKLKLE